MDKNIRHNIVPLLMMFALYFTISFVTGLQNPMAIIIKDQFNASNFMSQLGNFAVFIAYICMGIPSGIILQKIGYKKTALLAAIIGLISIIILYISGIAGENQFEYTYSIYLIGAFVSGFAICMLNTVVNPMTNTLAGGGKKGNQMMQIGGIFNSTGATIVPIFVGILMGNATKKTIQDANPALWLSMGIFVAAFIVLMLINIPEPHLNTSKKDDVKLKDVFAYRHFILGIIAIFMYVGVEVGIPNITNLFMTQGLGIDTAIAGTVVGTYWFLMLIGRFFGAAIASKVSSRTMLATATTIAALLVLCAILVPQAMVSMPVINSTLSFGMAQVPLNVLLLILCGLCTSVMWGGIFNLAIEGLGIYTEKASGLFMTMVCGGGIIPQIQSFIADSFGFINSYFVTLFGIIFMLWYALWGCKMKSTK